MGAQQAKKEINPNEERNNPPPNPNQQLERQIQQCFRKAAVNGLITKDKFNQTLAVLEGTKIKRLRDTPLADRLFELLDKQKSGSIAENECTKGISEIFSDKNNAIMYSFRAFDADMDNRISRRQFAMFLEESWRAAFRILGEMVEAKKQLGLSMGDVTNWSNNKISQLNEQTTKIFNQIDLKGTGFVEFIAFREWILNGPYMSIKAELADLVVEVPIHLRSIQKN